MPPSFKYTSISLSARMPSHLKTAVVFAVLSVSFAACSGEKGSGGAASPAVAAQGAGSGTGSPAGRTGGGGRRGGGPVPVVTAKVQTRSVPVTIPAVGTAAPLQTVQIRAQTTGQLSAMHFTEGQDVRKGQPLFTLDARPFQAALSQAEAVLARDTATANNAERQKVTYEDLFKRGLIPRDQYETQRASNEALQATLAADRAAVENAKLNLAYTHITAPISGRTGASSVHVGDLVRANDATALVVINQVAPIYVTFAVPGRYLGDIRRYQAQRPLVVTARGQAMVAPGAQAPAPPPPASQAQTVAPGQGATVAVPEGLVETGRVSFIDNAVDPSTGTITLKGTFQNASQGLWPGLFVTVMLSLTTDENALVVPATAVQPSASGQYVYVVTPERTAQVRPVEVARQSGEDMIIAKGLLAGEEVVIDGQLRLTPGSAVSIATGRGEGGRGPGGRGPGGRGPGGEGGQGGRRGSKQ